MNINENFNTHNSLPIIQEEIEEQSHNESLAERVSTAFAYDISMRNKMEDISFAILYTTSVLCTPYSDRQSIFDCQKVIHHAAMLSYEASSSSNVNLLHIAHIWKHYEYLISNATMLTRLRNINATNTRLLSNLLQSIRSIHDMFCILSRHRPTDPRLSSILDVHILSIINRIKD